MTWLKVAFMLSGWMVTGFLLGVVYTANAKVRKIKATHKKDVYRWE